MGIPPGLRGSFRAARVKCSAAKFLERTVGGGTLTDFVENHLDDGLSAERVAFLVIDYFYFDEQATARERMVAVALATFFLDEALPGKRSREGVIQAAKDLRDVAASIREIPLADQQKQFDKWIEGHFCG